ncbi:MAG: hypothetical protein GF313_14345 [Caldithrix sp.]|nr:hypothetical protein [Caldithrix sp.]
MKRTTKFLGIQTIIIIVFSLLLVSCTEFLKMLQETTIEKPNVQPKKIEITDFNFNTADMLLNVAINNPNSLGIDLQSYGYDLLIEGASFLKGRQDQGLHIEANGQSIIAVPFTITYKDLFETFKNLKNKDSLNYQVDMDLSFELPILGTLSIPVSKTDNLMVPRLPDVKLHTIQLDKIGFTGADLAVKIKVNNENPFSVLLDKLDYDLTINGARWADGRITEDIQIDKKGDSMLEIPLSLNFFEIGRSAYQLLSNRSELNYTLQGNADFKSSLPMLDAFKLPFNKKGSINVTDK